MNGVPTGKILIAVFVILLAMGAVFIIGSLQGGSSSSTTTTPVVTAPAKAPKDYLPSAVAGFEMTSKNDQVTPAFGETSAAAVSFKPVAGSMFENKVASLTFYAHVFSDTKSATNMAKRLAEGTAVLEFEINGQKARLNYKKDTGQATMFTQVDKTVAYCFATAPSGATAFDDAMLKNAVMMGFSAIKFQ